ncbi:signal recognition particle, SRP19 subunit [Aaosphaeria arxii CBS 175.79]|uniref:Signal recognition particle, SRP19 subunit n=1 Tax=Aaosphaeria arxii CBS 175.79 TaxID=1450172 RepID=A0A6A5XD85_9PLEO|nr:signal recognition particle, SRP19 subunit [Aaosphaeria arxii CBS 175.79]KAF2010962.1 signal recognition particle, SRP19 subunit [Aaosphaeria arxii CBS 175.79]
MNPRVEEISDSDSDPPEMDLSDVPSLISPASIPTSSSMPTQMLQPQSPAIKASADREASKHYQCLYPIYFDKSRTRAEGRRVGDQLAVENPLAREMADAAASLGLKTVFEPDKTHPKDWSNPGRIRILLKEDGKVMDHRIKNKHHLYILISQYLQQNPTEKNTPLRLRIAGLPTPKEPLPEPAVPRGWKVNTILPLHSPALTGGGVSENFLQDMMAEMGEMGGMPGMPALPGMMGGGASSTGGEGKKKKDKKKK